MEKELFNFSDFLSNIAIKSDKGEEMTYEQLQNDANKIKNSLNQGRLAFCLCSNTIASIVGYVAFVQGKVATVLLDAEKDQELLENLRRVYHPNYVWAPIGKVKGEEMCEYKGYALYKCSDIEIPINPNLSLLLTTSGSTGSPKLVRLTQKNLRSNADSIAEYLNITSTERPVTSLPMYYSFGMSVINSHFVKGATLLLTDKNVFQKDFWEFLKQEHATSIAGVPYTYEMLKRLRFFKMDLPDLKTMIQAGGKLNAAIAKEYIEFSMENGKVFIVMYGQTEASPRMSYLPFTKAQEKYASIGIAIPRGRFSIRDEKDNEINSPDIDGELIYMGDNVCMGYAECTEDLAKGDENHGILYTGDIARKDKDGFYYITGRMKRFVKVWGNRINLDAIEQMTKPIIEDCACIGSDDHVQIFITDGSKKDEVQEYLAEKMKLNYRAFTVKVVPDIPKKVSGKVDYSKL